MSMEESPIPLAKRLQSRLQTREFFLKSISDNIVETPNRSFRSGWSPFRDTSIHSPVDKAKRLECFPMSPNSPFKKTNYSTSMCEDSATEHSLNDSFSVTQTSFGVRTPTKKLIFGGFPETEKAASQQGLQMEEDFEDHFSSMDEEREEEEVGAVNEGVYVVDVIQPVVDRFSVTLNTGGTFRASLSMKPSTSLVAECLDAIKYGFSLSERPYGMPWFIY